MEKIKNDNVFDLVIDEVFEIESRTILSNIAFASCMFLSCTDEEDVKPKLKYIQSVLEQCYKLGQLKIVIQSGQHKEGNHVVLFGYSMMFIHPSESLSDYIHSVFVKDEFRGNGLGTEMVKLLAENNKCMLLCTDDNISFYEKLGFRSQGHMDLQEYDNISMLQNVYCSANVMVNYKEKISAPIFMLNDKDVFNMLNNVESCCE